MRMVRAIGIGFILATLLALQACKPEKSPSTGATGGPTATGSTQAAACEKLLRNDKGEYSAGKCVCSQDAGNLWTCTIGD